MAAFEVGFGFQRGVGDRCLAKPKQGLGKARFSPPILSCHGRGTHPLGLCGRVWLIDRPYLLTFLLTGRQPGKGAK